MDCDWRTILFLYVAATSHLLTQLNCQSQWSENKSFSATQDNEELVSYSSQINHLECGTFTTQQMRSLESSTGMSFIILFSSGQQPIWVGVHKNRDASDRSIALQYYWMAAGQGKNLWSWLDFYGFIVFHRLNDWVPYVIWRTNKINIAHWDASDIFCSTNQLAVTKVGQNDRSLGNIKLSFKRSYSG